MSDEKLLEQVSETEDSGYLEAYIRFNNDLEKDYCFQILVKKTFKHLLKIFETLPIALRPNIFYNSRPVGFKVSTSPGYLTEDGSLLFSYEATHPEYTRRVRMDDNVSENIWPGQLILPIWEYNPFYHYSFISALLCWLYTDLPDAISPTPGICLTNQVSKLASWICTSVGLDTLAQALLEDIQEPASITAQILFFVFHIFKVSIIYLMFHLGTFNPIRVWKTPGSSTPTDVKKEQLLAIGWTGSRRATPDDYKEFYRDYKIQKHGGLVQAHQAGLFDKLKNLGTFLGDGEGFNTPLDTRSTLKDLLSEENTKLTLNYEYLALLGETFAKQIPNDNEGTFKAVKDFRSYGLVESNQVIQKIVSKRKKLGDAKLKIQK